MATGLVGCVRLLDVNNRVLNLQENGGNSQYGSGVGECGNNPCQPDPCKNGAACQVKEAEMFHCKCSKGFWGRLDDMKNLLFKCDHGFDRSILMCVDGNMQHIRPLHMCLFQYCVSSWWKVVFISPVRLHFRDSLRS